MTDKESTFPSLQQRAMVAIVQHLADNKIGAFDFSKFYIHSSNPIRFRFQGLLAAFPLPKCLKSCLSDIMIGVHYQMWHFYSLHETKDCKVVFDCTGKVHEPRTWELYFKHNWSDCNEVSRLHLSLLFALKKQLLPQIEDILRKILIQGKGEVAETWLKEPQKRLLGTKLAVTYKFQKFHQPSAYEVFHNFHFMPNIAEASFNLNKCGITISFTKLPQNLQGFKDLYGLLDQTKRNRFTFDVLLQGTSASIAEFIVNAPEQLQISHLFPSLIENELYNCLLQWPYTEAFLRLFERINHQKYRMYHRKFFVEIIERIPDEGQFGHLHCELLSDYWSLLNDASKCKFRILLECRRFQTIMEKLKRKNKSLYNMIVRDVSNMTDVSQDTPRPKCSWRPNPTTTVNARRQARRHAPYLHH